MIGHYKVSCFITYLSVVCGVIGCYFIFNGNINISVIFLILAGVFDMLDGKFARKEKRSEKEKEYGIQLDSLADSFNYIALPICISISLGFYKAYYLPIYALLGVCSVIRLAYYNVYSSDKNKAIDKYKGLPVTTIAIIVPFLYLISFISKKVFVVIYPLGLLITAILYIAKIDVKKPTGKWYIIFGVLALIGILLMLFL